MAGPDSKQFQKEWIGRAARLHREGYFSEYTSSRRDEVLRKGYLGKYSPDQGLVIARRLVKEGISTRTPKFNDEMRDHFQLVGEDVREALVRILDEIRPESYKPPRQLSDPPGLPFHFHSKTLRSDVYFKFQIGGTQKKPQVLFWSCHPPVYRSERVRDEMFQV